MPERVAPIHSAAVPPIGPEASVETGTSSFALEEAVCGEFWPC